MSNLVVLPVDSGSDVLRFSIRHALSLAALSDPSLCAPIDESFAFGTTRGRVRKRNEDRLAVIRVFGAKGERPWMLYALSDGMGGMANGAQAAELALAAFLCSAVTSRLGCSFHNLFQSVLISNKRVYDEYGGRSGATLSAIATNGTDLVTLNVGDSRLWGVTQKSGLERWSQDDSIRGQLEARGIINDDARRDLIQYVGVGSDIHPHLSTKIIDSSRTILITSDGVHDLPIEVLRKVVAHGENVSNVAHRLLELANWTGGVDNASVVCLQPQTPACEHAGIVELWVPGGYWRFVSREQSVMSAKISTGSQNADPGVPVAGAFRPDGNSAKSKSKKVYKSRKRGRGRDDRGAKSLFSPKAQENDASSSPIRGGVDIHFGEGSQSPSGNLGESRTDPPGASK